VEIIMTTDESHDSRTAAPAPERPEVLTPSTPGGQGVVPSAETARGEQATEDSETVGQPGKVMRIGTMVKQLLDEVKAAPLDDASRVRMAEIYQRSVDELAGALSPDLENELRNLAHPFAGGHVPSDAELRVAQAQLVGWLEGLFHGIQATLMAQQMAARQQLEQMRGRALPPGAGPPEDETGRPGTYL
jgi:hypothetical protein